MKYYSHTARPRLIRCRSTTAHDRMKEKAVRTPPGAAGFEAPVHVVKCLQIALCGCNPGERANEEELVQRYGQRYGLPFNTKPCTNPHVRQPHRVRGKFTGLYLSPDGPHETNHAPQCRACV
ncbi:unnamed protein product [Sphacelaria rigidula]